MVLCDVTLWVLDFVIKLKKKIIVITIHLVDIYSYLNKWKNSWDYCHCQAKILFICFFIRIFLKFQYFLERDYRFDICDREFRIQNKKNYNISIDEFFFLKKIHKIIIIVAINSKEGFRHIQNFRFFFLQVLKSKKNLTTYSIFMSEYIQQLTGFLHPEP